MNITYAIKRLFEFFNLPHKNRKTYITRGINNSLVKRFNAKAY